MTALAEITLQGSYDIHDPSLHYTQFIGTARLKWEPVPISSVHGWNWVMVTNFGRANKLIVPKKAEPEEIIKISNLQEIINHRDCGAGS